MFKSSRCARFRHPFEVLGLSRSATKAEVKHQYRQLAKQCHPDSPGGNAVRMEEINRAYNTLMKEGGFERFHVKGGAGTSMGAAAGPTSAGAGVSSRPSAARGYGSMEDCNDSGSAGGEESVFAASAGGPSGLAGYRLHPKPFSDDMHDAELRRLSGLDPATERVTPEGRYMYQNRDSGEWVALDRPLVRAKEARYQSHARAEEDATFQRQQAANKAFWEELGRRSAETTEREKARTPLERAMNRAEDAGYLPSRNKVAFLALCAYAVYISYGFFQERMQGLRKYAAKTEFFDLRQTERHAVEEAYLEHAGCFDVATAAAAAIYLAAAITKAESDPVVTPPPDEFIYSVPKKLYKLMTSL